MENEQIKIEKPIWKKWWYWVPIIVALILVVISLLGSGEDKTTPITEEVGQKTQPTEATATKEWVKVISLTANADKQSGTFRLKGGHQRVLYGVSDSSYGMCAIYVMKEGTDLMEEGGFPIVTADGGATDETMMRKGKGDYYLDVKVANATCIVEVYEYR